MLAHTEYNFGIRKVDSYYASIMTLDIIIIPYIF